MARNVRTLILAALLPLLTSLWAACVGGTSAGLARGPSNEAVVADFGAPPDSVMQVAWEVLRSDGVMARSFQRMAGDTTNTARMESDWIHVPTVFPAAPLSGVARSEQYIKLLMWAEPFRGGTRLYVEPLYDPTTMPTEPVQWARLEVVPQAHPSWQYVDEVAREITRRLGEQ